MKILLFLVMFSMGCAEIFRVPSPFITNELNEEIGICRFPQKYYIHTSIDNSYEAFIIDRFNEWNSVVGFKVFIFAGWTNFDPFWDDFYAPKSIIITKVDGTLGEMITDAEYPDMLAKATLKVTRNCIDYATITLTDSLLQNDNKEFLKGALLHEIGHVLGLNHNNNSQSIMRKYIKPSIDFANIGQEDIKHISQKYKGIKK
jgi:hypothetical protein